MTNDIDTRDMSAYEWLENYMNDEIRCDQEDMYCLALTLAERLSDKELQGILGKRRRYDEERFYTKEEQP